MEPDRWNDTRTAVAETVERFATLLQGVRDPSAPAVGDWTVGDVAAHVRVVSMLNTLFATGGRPADAWETVYDMAITATVAEVRDVNARALLVQPERDPRVLAPLIRRQVDRLLDGTSELRGDEPIAWLGGVKVPVVTVLGHMLSELFVHGTDIARAERRDFPLPRARAPLIFDAFLLNLLRSPDAARFAGDRADAAQPVTCALRIRGSAPVVLVAGEDGVSIEQPGARPVDVTVSADPAAMWLVMCGRVNPLRAAARGRVVVWGRRPWRLRRLMDLLHTP
jgi:uncharacterized protein (TIGR03083 family)